MPGSWTYSADISPYEYSVFYTAVSGLQEYFYIPVAVATQVVNGTNYRYVAIAEPLGSGLSPHFVIVSIFQPIAGMPYVKEITPI